jgi:hypothetical protein
MFHSTATLIFPDGAMVVGEYISDDPYDEPIKLSGSIERLPVRELKENDHGLQYYFQMWANDLGASYRYRSEGEYTLLPDGDEGPGGDPQE